MTNPIERTGPRHLWAILSILAATPVSAEALEQALAEAYHNNPALKAEEAVNRATQEGVAQAKAQFGPSVSATGSYEYTRTRLAAAPFPSRAEGWNTNYEFSVRQPLFLSGQLTGLLKRVRAGERIAFETVRGSTLSLLAGVVATYAFVLRDQRLVAIAEENVRLLGDQLKQTDARFKARYATSTDLNQTENRRSFGLAQLELARGNLLASRNSYRNLVGHYPGALAPLPTLPPLPTDLDRAQGVADTNNPSLRIARLTEEASRATLGQVRGQRGPNVELIGSIARSPLSVQFDQPYQVTTGARIQLTIPLYTSGLLTAQVREAIQRNDADHQRVEQQSRDVREGVATFWDQLSATRRALPAYRDAVRAAQAALDGARKQEVAGQVTSLDVLDTARDLLTSRTAEAQADAQLYIQHANLLATIGTLDIASFDASAKPYDPSAYTTTPLSGLPTGPIIQPLDSLLYDDSVRHSTVQLERDAEPGHDMAPEPPSVIAGETPAP